MISPTWSAASSVPAPPAVEPANVQPVAQRVVETPAVEQPAVGQKPAPHTHPAAYSFSVLEAEFQSIMYDTLETVKAGEANVLNATASEIVKVKAKWI